MGGGKEYPVKNTGYGTGYHVRTQADPLYIDVEAKSGRQAKSVSL